MTSTELTIAPQREGWVELLKPASELAHMISNTEFVPKSLRGRDAAIVSAIMTAHELGVGPMTALANIAIIDGRPALYATLMRALVLQRGHDIWFDELTTTKVTACGQRKNSENVTRVTWSSEMARNAGLLGKDSWKKYPRSMLEARASSELCRAIFADCLAGLTVSVEELDDQVVPATTSEENGGAPTRRRRRPTVTVVDAQASTPPPPEQRPPLPGEPETSASPTTNEGAQPEPADGTALRRMHVLFGELEIGNRADRLAVTRLIVEREIQSSKDLTAAELDAVCNVLTDVREGNAILQRTDAGWELKR